MANTEKLTREERERLRLFTRSKFCDDEMRHSLIKLVTIADAYEELKEENERLKAENERLKAENERIRRDQIVTALACATAIQKRNEEYSEPWLTAKRIRMFMLRELPLDGYSHAEKHDIFVESENLAEEIAANESLNRTEIRKENDDENE